MPTLPSPEVARQERWTLLAVLLVLLAGLGPSVLSFPQTWSRSYQEHGFFLAGLAIWLAWRDRERIRLASRSGLPGLVPILTACSVLWMLAVIMDVGLVHQLLFVALMTLWSLSTFGWRVRQPILAITGVLLLAVPFWSILVPVLRSLTTVASGALARLAGVSAVIEANTISISSGTFLVENGCSGINYLLGGLTLGTFYAHLFTDRWQTQVKIVSIAAGMSIVGNWIRVATLVLLGEATSMRSPLIEDHLWLGWATFAVLMVPAYFLARAVERRDASKGDGRLGGLELEGEPVDPHRVRRAWISGLAVLIGPFLLTTVGLVPRGGALETDMSAVGVSGDWPTREGGADARWLPDFTGVDRRAHWLVDVDETSIEVSRHYFVDQRQGEELIQGANRIAADSLLVSERVVGPLGAGGRLAREAILFGEDGAPRIVWYWYRVAGVETAFASKAKLLEVLAFFRRAPAAELHTLSTTCGPEDCADAARALRRSLEGRGSAESGPRP